MHCCCPKPQHELLTAAGSDVAACEKSQYTSTCETTTWHSVAQQSIRLQHPSWPWPGRPQGGRLYCCKPPHHTISEAGHGCCRWQSCAYALSPDHPRLNMPHAFAHTCALVSRCMSDRRPQSALQPNLLNAANSKGASQVPSPQIGSTQTVCSRGHTTQQGI